MLFFPSHSILIKYSSYLHRPLSERPEFGHWAEPIFGDKNTSTFVKKLKQFFLLFCKGLTKQER